MQHHAEHWLYGITAQGVEAQQCNARSRTSQAMEPCMKRSTVTFSFGSQRHMSKSSRYTGRRRRGPHR